MVDAFNTQPRITVLMTVYSEPVDFVEKAINSILSQTFKDFEYIIILDKPDNRESFSYLTEWSEKDNRIRFYVNEKNIGLARSLNRGIDLAQGYYIARMDADDISKPQRLERELQFIETSGADMVCCLVDKIDEKGEKWDQIKPFPNSPEFIERMLPIQDIVVHPTVLMNTERVKALGGYRPFSACQDYDCWLRMLTSGYQIKILNENLLYFRRHKNSITASKRYVQLLNEVYIKQLYKERVGIGTDSFSENNLADFMKAHYADDRGMNDKENQKAALYRQGVENLKRKKLVSGGVMILSSLSSYTVRESIKVTANAIKVKNQFGG
ncbi:MAG: glycosyltransferase [Clostridia bacterium]|nr:glycosyltransferase [Clostridia bacterium]